MSSRRPWPLPRWAGFLGLGRHLTASCTASPLATPSRQAASLSPRTARSYLRPASSRSASHQPVFFARVLLAALVSRTASTNTKVACLVSTPPAEPFPLTGGLQLDINDKLRCQWPTWLTIIPYSAVNLTNLIIMYRHNYSLLSLSRKASSRKSTTVMPCFIK